MIRLGRGFFPGQPVHPLPYQVGGTVVPGVLGDQLLQVSADLTTFPRTGALGVTVDLLRSIVGDAVVESIAPGVVEYGMPGGSITELLLDGTRVSVVDIADVGHLSDEDRSGHVPG